MKRIFSIAMVALLVFSTLSVLSIVPVLAAVDEYFIYSRFDPPGINDVTAAGGYVEYYGVPEWGDEIQYVYFLSGNIGYKVKVWVTDGDGDGKIEPRQHPNHYIPEYQGPIEPRHFQIVSSKDLTGYTYGSGGHTEEFYVDSSGVYLGAYPYGINKWDHDWNYIGKIANSPPERCESMAYNPAENIWYAGGRYRTIYQLKDTDGDGSFLDESWQAIFTYPNYGGSHHDGMEYVGGYLWISDMTSDVIGKWQYNPSTGVWQELKRFTYTEPRDVEGMGFGPNDHFWVGSGWGSGSYLYELGNEITKGYPIADAGPDVLNHPPTIPIKFDASGSHHTDPTKQIVLYEWDFESDGTWDYSGTDLIVEHAYPAYYNPDGSIDWDKTAKAYTATLRVTDNSNPPLQTSDTRIVHITAPPWKPVADPDGPHEGSANTPVQLDGSKSYDPESTMFPPEHPWYEIIATYEWDLDHDGQFDDATGANPTHTWDSEGLYIIGLKVTDSQPSGPGGTIGPLDVDIKYTTVVIKKPIFNLAVVFTEFSDDDPAPSRSMADFGNIKNDLISYYTEVSYGTVSFDIKFYPNDDSWLRLPHNRKYYGENTPPDWMKDENIDQFIIDAIDVSYGTIDFTEYDYDATNGRGMVIFIHPGYAEQHGKSTDDLQTCISFSPSISGGYPTKDGANIDGIVVAEMDNVGAWAHEIGHALGKLLVTTVLGTSKDDSWMLPDRYKAAGRGDIGYWGLMGGGSWLPLDWLGSGTDGTHPDHMCSYSKEWLGWLKSREYQHPSYGAYWINSLTTMRYGDDVFKYKINDNMYYILEVRNKNSQYSTWDTTAPIQRPAWPALTYDSAEVIYKVEKKNNMWIVNVVSHIVLFPLQDYHSDNANEVLFTVVDESWGTTYEMKTEIKKPSIWKKIGAVLNPKALLLSLIPQVIHGTPFQFEYPLPDLDLHAYSDDGKHVGMNYATGEYETQIPEATASGDLWNGQEWIFVPEDVNVHFVVNAKDNKDFFDAFPEAWEISNGIEAFDLNLVYYDSDGNRWESSPITEQINPGETIWHIPAITENPDGTYTTGLTPITWEYVYEDPARGTVLKISTDDKHFQFISPNKEFLVKHDPRMRITNRAIIILYKDWEIKIVTVAIDTKLDLCVAVAWDVHTGKQYFLMDKAGVE
jgi:M6 family metalloprotease-like protein